MNFKDNQQSLLTFRVGPVLCCAPSMPAQSIITPPKLTHLAGSDASQPGIFKHGSHIIKVLDLRQKFGVDASEQTHPGNLIVCIFEKDGFAFWVDQILDVFDFPSEGWGNLPAAIPRGVFSRTLLLNNKIHLYSEFEKLSTINDLGYLKHYIQQLTENETKKSPAVNTIEASSIKTSSIKTSDITTSDIKPAAKTDSHEQILLATSANEQIKPSVETKEHHQYQSASTASTASTASKDSGLFNTDVNNKVSAAKKQSINTASLSEQLNKKTSTHHTSIKTPDKTPSAISTGASNHVTISASQNTTRPLHQLNTFSNTSKKLADSTVPSKPSDIRTETSPSKYNDEQSNIGVVIFFILLLLLPLVGIYYFLMQETPKPYKYEKIEEPANTEIILNSDSELKPLTKHEPAETSTVTEAVIDTTEDTSTTFVETEAETDSLDATPYRADITQQDDEITITIHQPVSNDDVSEQALIQETVIATEEIDEEDQTEPVIASLPIKSLQVETLQEDELNTPIPPAEVIKEVIHTVVKGDTLWAIAKKYVNNPFLYPELARLSNIKNPHRIYPGNRVRIRFIKN